MDLKRETLQSYIDMLKFAMYKERNPYKRRRIYKALKRAEMLYNKLFREHNFSERR